MIVLASNNVFKKLFLSRQGRAELENYDNSILRQCDSGPS